MNADLKRVRDSSLDELPSPAKRRAMSVSTPPPEEGDEGGIEDWMKVVEVRVGFQISAVVMATRSTSHYTLVIRLYCGTERFLPFHVHRH